MSNMGAYEVEMMGVVRQTEDRWSQRRPASLPVEIVVNGAKWATSQTRDVGLGGVFVELDRNQPYEGSDLELFFLFQDAENMSRYRLKARVVRQAADGVGLMFRDFDTHAFRALQEIMRRVPKPEHE